MPALPARVTPEASIKLRKKLIGVALASPEFKQALIEAANEIRSIASPESSEATIEGCFERVLYALLKDIGLKKFHPEKEVHIDLRRHIARGRLDSRFGAVVIEYKRPSLLQTTGHINKALGQLEEYLVSLSSQTENLFVGILTNGLVVLEVRAQCGVILSHSPLTKLDNSALDRIARLLTSLDLAALTPHNLIRDFCGSETDGVLFRTARVLDGILATGLIQKTKMLQTEWEAMFRLSHEDLSQQQRIEDRRLALGAIFEVDIDDATVEYRTLFALQTAYAILLKLMAYRIVSDVYWGSVRQEFRALSASRSVALRSFCNHLEDGEVFRQVGILNLLEGDFFSWYTDKSQWSRPLFESIQEILVILARYEEVSSIFSFGTAIELFRDLYQSAIPHAVRSSFGEFFTPYWLAEHVIDSALLDNHWRAIDPCCGSGTFVIAAIARLRKELNGHAPNFILSEILTRIAAIDLNPLSVLTTRIHFFIHINDLIPEKQIEPLVIPVYLGDAASMPEHIKVSGIDCLSYQLSTLKAPINAVLPTSIVKDTPSFIHVMAEYEQLIKAKNSEDAVALLMERLSTEESLPEIKALIEDTTEQLVNLERNRWNGIWARILSNFLTTACLGEFSAVVGNPPWIDWKNLPENYRKRIASLCIDRGLFSGAGRTGGINLNICALIAYTSINNWLSDTGRLAFLMPKALINQASYEGWRRLGGTGRRILCFHDWSAAGHPFDPVKEDFMTYIIGNTTQDVSAIPLTSYRKKAGDKTKANSWKAIDEAMSHLDVISRVAGQIISQSTAFTVADNEEELRQFAHIAGSCEYIGREGIEFYPQELLLFTYDSPGPSSGTVWLQNIQRTKSKYKQHQRRILLETKYLYPLVKGPQIGSFKHYYEGLIVAFPYEVGNPKKPIPKNELRFTSRHLYDYYNQIQETLENQTKYSDKIRGKDPGDFYGLARTGLYSFAGIYVGFRDNTKWCATVVSDAIMPWGEKKRFVFQNHAAFMCERKDNKEFITEDEAHYICAILNTPIVQRFIYATSDERSFKIRPPVYVPLYDPMNRLHNALSNASKLAHTSLTDGLVKKMEEWYLKMCSHREKSQSETAHRKGSRPGPKPEVLKINGDWREAVKKSLAKKKPKAGWPK